MAQLVPLHRMELIIHCYTCVSNHCRWRYWGRMNLSGFNFGESGKGWYQLCRHRYLCEVHTHKMLVELMKKGYHVVHLSGDELDCFSDFLNRWGCPVEILLCVLDDILYRNPRC